MTLQAYNLHKRFIKFARQFSLSFQQQVRQVMNNIEWKNITYQPT